MATKHTGRIKAADVCPGDKLAFSSGARTVRGVEQAGNDRIRVSFEGGESKTVKWDHEFQMHYE